MLAQNFQATTQLKTFLISVFSNWLNMTWNIMEKLYGLFHSAFCQFWSLAALENNTKNIF